MGIMSGLHIVEVDVRDMLGAQALAVLSRAMAQLAGPGALAVRYTTEDVKHDLFVWAHERGHDARETGATQLQITRHA